MKLVSPNMHHFLTRGVLKTDEGFWVGHTVKRGLEAKNPCNYLMENRQKIN